jgi:hypothetical protein
MTTLANLTTYISGESQSFLSAIEQSRGGLRSLVASLDPVAAATAKYNRQVEMLEAAIRRQPAMADQYGLALQRLTQRYQQQISGQGALTNSTGQMRSGMQQLSFQLGDIATQFASGTQPMIIFAQQGGQVIQAVQMMSSSTRGLLGFLGGPWGQVLTAAAIVTSALGAKLFSTADAAKLAEKRFSDAADGADAFSDAQSILGQMVDLATGKLKVQNETLRASIRLQAMLAIEEGNKKRAEAGSAIVSASRREVGGFSTITPGGTGLGQPSPIRAATPELRSVADMFLANQTSTEDAIKQLEKLSGQGKIAKDVYRDMRSQFVELAQAADRVTASSKIIDYLDGKGLDSRLVPYDKPGKPKKGPADRSDQRQERVDDQIARLKQEQANLLIGITSDVRERAELEHNQVHAALEAYKLDLDHQVTQDEIKGEEAKRLFAIKERNAELEHTRVNWRLDRELDQQDLALKRDEVAASVDAKEYQLSLARTMAERRVLMRAILDDEIELKRFTAQQVLDSKASAAEKEVAQRELDRLDAERARGGAQIVRQTMGPLAQLVDQIPRTAADMNEAFEAVAANGLQSVNDGLAEAIAGTRSLGDVFKNITNQIIADLARIMIQRNITGPLANSLSGEGGGSGLFSGLGKLLGFASAASGGASAGSGSGGFGFTQTLPKLAGGGTMRVGGLAGVDRNLLSIGGVPRAWVSDNENLHVTPAKDQGGRSRIVFDMRGAVMTTDLLRQMEGIAAAGDAELVSTTSRAQAWGRRNALA